VKQRERLIGRRTKMESQGRVRPPEVRFPVVVARETDGERKGPDGPRRIRNPGEPEQKPDPPTRPRPDPPGVIAGNGPSSDFRRFWPEIRRLPVVIFR
jgi:hypothetical protein